MMLTRFVPPIFRSQPSKSGRVESASRADGRFALAASIMLAVFLFFGGTGAPHPLMLLPLEVLGLIALGGILYYHLFHRRIRVGFWPVGLILGGGLTLGWLQLLPLPWDLWRSLPGRGLAAAAIEEAGRAGAWREWSLAPAYTRSALLTVLPAVAVFLFAAGLTLERRLQMVRIVLAVALASAALGLLQVLAPNTPALYLSPRAVFDLSSGIFANRNFQATFLLAAIVICVTVSRIAGISRGKTSFVGWTLGIIAFLSALVLATQSRFGLLGLIMVLALCAVALGFVGWPAGRGSQYRAKVAIAGREVPPLAIAAALALAIAVGLSMFQGVFARFNIGPTEDSVGELRVTAIPDLLTALSAYFPVGTGLGTFDPIFRSVESLELVSPVFFNHAHDDYLELIIEMGVVGAVLPGALLIALAIAGWRAWRGARRDPRRILTLGAIGGMIIILLHSIVDYPLRTITIQCVFALLAAICFVPEPSAASAKSARGASSTASRWMAGAAIAVAVIAGSLAIARTQVARQAVQARAGDLAYLADRTNPRGAALYADAMLMAGQHKRAESLAVAAIEASPIDAVAMRVLGMARNAALPGSGDAALLHAARMGWREGQTQSWMVERAILARRWRVAAMRAEALARLGRDKTVTYGFLALLSTQPEARRYLLRSLSAAPSWRRHFLTNDDARTIEQRRGMAALIAGLAGSANPPTLAEARPTIDGLFREGDPAAAELYRSTLRSRSGRNGNLLWDGGFALPAKDYQPGPNNTVFDWRTYDSGSSFGTIERPVDRNDQALALGGSFGDTGRLAEKVTALAGGRYRLTWRARRDNADDARGMDLIVRCNNGPELAVRSLAQGLTEAWGSFAVDFTVPQQSCPFQSVSFAARDVTVGTRPVVYLDDLVLRPLTP
jgi:O-antigen ligase